MSGEKDESDEENVEGDVDEEELSVEGDTPHASDGEDEGKGDKHEPDKPGASDEVKKPKSPAPTKKSPASINKKPESPRALNKTPPTPKKVAKKEKEKPENPTAEEPAEPTGDDANEKENDEPKLPDLPYQWPPEPKEKSPDLPKDYVERPRKRVVIPCVLPWEHVGAKETQKGMSSFGAGRNAVTHITASKEFDSSKKSEAELSLFAEMNKYASQSGMWFGGHRRNIVRSKGGKDIDPELLQQGEGIIRKQAGSNQLPSQAGNTPMGANRLQTTKIKYKEGMSDGFDSESSTLIGKMFQSNPNNRAGTNVMGKHRRQTPEVPKPQITKLKTTKKGRKQKVVHKDESIPRLFDPRLTPGSNATGTGAGSCGLNPPRQVTTKVTGGYTLTEEDIIESKKVIPWATSASMASQEGMGGYGKIRDVVSKAKVNL